MKFNTIIFVSLLILANYTFAMQKAVATAQCPTLNCVRKNIDAIDTKLITLIGQRLAYVKRAGELKKNIKSIHDPAREAKILHTVGQQAENAGYPAAIAIAIFKTILAQANVYERQFHQE